MTIAEFNLVDLGLTLGLCILASATARLMQPNTTATFPSRPEYNLPMSGATTVEFFDTVLPGTATFTPDTTGSSIVGSFSWTPTAADVGFHGFETYGRFSSGSANQISGSIATFEITAVPEPTTLALLGLATPFAVLLRRRKA